MLFFISPFLVSFASLPFSMIVEMQRFDYSQLNIIGRLLNLLIFFVLVLSLSQFSNQINMLLVFKWYKIGIFILLLTALWHALSLYTGLVSWPFETRSNLHSAYGNTYSFTDRVTGIAREPSFFVMYVVDFIALAFIFFSGLKRNAAIIFACFIMLLSLSPSGYIVLIMCFCLSYFFTKMSTLSFSGLCKLAALFCFFVFFTFFVLGSNNPFFEYIINRVINVDASSSSRLSMLLGPFEWVKDSSLISFVFGHGLKSFAIVGTNYVLPSGEAVHVTSNNMYVDVFWEAGVLGLLLMLLYFLFIFVKIFSVKQSQQQQFVTFFVFFDLVLSAVFRADYASLRFFLMLYLLFLLLNYDIGLGKVKSARSSV
ncbi:hypothetical protein AR688_09295 [Rheinheimera sp. EpRS3]|nr:hypothetical protein AR688_09295 [Rheinheimera sp. EpRS3]